jgi:aryl-alcohol dehydrogenase-like predicted oxidoreductase
LQFKSAVRVGYMRRRTLCGLEVSEIGFGGWVVGSELYRLSDEEARRLINKALDLGINLFDTADVYGRGRSEELLGQWLRGYDVVISTKVGYDFYHFEKPTRRFDPDYLSWAAAKSAERLGRWPDILMIHNPTADAVRNRALAQGAEGDAGEVRRRSPGARDSCPGGGPRRPGGRARRNDVCL